jgi:hypothetical protein
MSKSVEGQGKSQDKEEVKTPDSLHVDFVDRTGHKRFHLGVTGSKAIGMALVAILLAFIIAVDRGLILPSTTTSKPLPSQANTTKTLPLETNRKPSLPLP